MFHWLRKQDRDRTCGKWGNEKRKFVGDRVRGEEDSTRGRTKGQRAGRKITSNICSRAIRAASCHQEKSANQEKFARWQRRNFIRDERDEGDSLSSNLMISMFVVPSVLLATYTNESIFWFFDSNDQRYHGFHKYKCLPIQTSPTGKLRPVRHLPQRY